MNDFLNWGLLGTFAGSVATVTALTQIAKNFIRLNPKWISLILSVVVVFTVNLKYDVSIQNIILSGLNALLVTGLATGAYKHAVEPVEDYIKAEVIASATTSAL